MSRTLLARSGPMPASSSSRDALFHRRRAEDGRRARHELGDARPPGRTWVPWRTGRAGENQPQMGWRSTSRSRAETYEERRGARPGVDVLVGAADREIHVAAVQVDGHRADGVAQVPEHQRPGLVHDRRDARHVGQGAAAVGHVRQAHQGRVLVHRGAHQLRIDALVDVGGQHPQLQAALGRDALDDVPVAGEVVGVGHDHAPPGPRVQRRAGQLVQVHRGVVGDQDLPGRGAGELADQVARPGRQVHPVVPGPGQGRAPFLAEHAVHPPQGRQGQRAERVAVQVDQPGLAEQEALAVPAERVRRVKLPGLRPVQHHLRHTAHHNAPSRPAWTSIRVPVRRARVDESASCGYCSGLALASVEC